jgi:hypothetical protein
MFWPWGRCMIHKTTCFQMFWLFSTKNFHHNLNSTKFFPSFNCRCFWICVYPTHWVNEYPPFGMCPWRWMYKNISMQCVTAMHPSLWGWLASGMWTSTCASYTHSQLLLSTNGHCFLKRWGLQPNEYHCNQSYRNILISSIIVLLEVSRL